MAMQQYEAMASAYQLGPQFLNAQLHALSSTILFTEILKLNGNPSAGESMLERLNQTINFETGFMSPISFGPNDRIGSEKVFILTIDIAQKQLKSVN